MPGALSLEAPAGCCRAASVFVSMCEQEGFGMPVIEAMNFDIPIVAFKATAVPYSFSGAWAYWSTKSTMIHSRSGRLPGS
jgi:glycosyltransferase involved in cell wall biosynthesis